MRCGCEACRRDENLAALRVILLVLAFFSLFLLLD